MIRSNSKTCSLSAGNKEKSERISLQKGIMSSKNVKAKKNNNSKKKDGQISYKDLKSLKDDNTPTNNRNRTRVSNGSSGCKIGTNKNPTISSSLSATGGGGSREREKTQRFDLFYSIHAKYISSKIHKVITRC